MVTRAKQPRSHVPPCMWTTVVCATPSAMVRNVPPTALFHRNQATERLLCSTVITSVIAASLARAALSAAACKRVHRAGSPLHCHVQGMIVRREKSGLVVQTVVSHCCCRCRPTRSANFTLCLKTSQVSTVHAAPFCSKATTSNQPGGGSNHMLPLWQQLCTAAWDGGIA